MISCYAKIINGYVQGYKIPELAKHEKFKSRAVCSYSRFVAFIRAATWLKKDLMQSLWFYGIAPPPENAALSANAPYLPGFEKMFAKSMG